MAILNKNIIFSFSYKIGEQEDRTGAVWRGWYRWEVVRMWERL
jgi:hypothetical protein